MGTPSYATTILKALVQCGSIEVPLVTQEDKPVGRKQILTPPDTKAWVLQEGLEKSINLNHCVPKKRMRKLVRINLILLWLVFTANFCQNPF